MAELIELALQYQQALDGHSAAATSTAVEATGLALELAMREAAFPAAGDGSAAWKVFQPIILQTTLATSIVAYFERTPWAALTPQMLSARGAAHGPSALESASRILLHLFHSALHPDCSTGKTVAALLLRQVRAPSPGKYV
jgi:hypothetical protein